MTHRRYRSTVAVLGVAGLTLAACGGDDGAGTDESSTDQPVVIATTSIWADVVANIACDDSIEVRTLIPTGGDPHGFEPSLQDREALAGAALVVANGLDLEESLVDTLEAVEADGVPVFHVADHVETIPFAGVAHDDDHQDEGRSENEAHSEDEAHAEDDHAHEGDDPHLWMDARRVVEALPAIAEALTAAGMDATAADDCADAYAQRLTTADAEAEALLAAVPADERLLVTNHEALGYFADRHGFELVGAVIPGGSTLAEPNAADLAELATLITELGVPAIFAENLQTASDADALAARLDGVTVVTLFTDSLGDAESGADTLEALTVTNARLVADALTGSA